jgi:hypothetical protein
MYSNYETSSGMPIMRRLALITAAFALAASAAVAAPAAVTVTVGPELQRKATKDYGLRDIERLTAELQKDVSKSLADSGRYADARVELTLVDAKPNRPTFKQMGDTPGLSMLSHGIGGAQIEGRIVAVDGAVTPISYSWYETDIRESWGVTTWHDAQWTFERFAKRIARGDRLAAR